MDLNFEVQLSTAGKKFEGNIREIMQISEGKLSEEFSNQPSTYAWFAALSEYAGADVENKKFNLSVLKANLDKQKRSEFVAKGDKVTETVVASAIQIDPEYIKANLALIDLERQYGILKAIVQGLQQRKDMLIQLGVMKRQEMVLGDFGVNLPKVRNNN